MKARNIFLSLEARGKFGNIAVANLTRGIQILKKKVDPTNPKTPKQKEQRQIYADGRKYYHSLCLTERDRTSFSRLSRLFRKKLNTFQFFMFYYYWTQEGGFEVNFASQVIANPVLSGKLYVYCEAVTGLEMSVNINRKFNWNTTRYPMTEILGTGKYQTLISGLISGEKYYFIFAHIGAEGIDQIDSGLYSERVK